MSTGTQRWDLELTDNMLDDWNALNDMRDEWFLVLDHSMADIHAYATSFQRFYAKHDAEVFWGPEEDRQCVIVKGCIVLPFRKLNQTK